METIRTYVENMFSTLQKTSELKKLKQEILMNMEEKYMELKSEGKTENEAIGIVISEFGNIDEIINEFDVEVEKDENLRTVDVEEAHDIVSLSKKTDFIISIGVILIMGGVALLILLFQLHDDGLIFKSLSEDKMAFFPITLLLLSVGIAVALFIFADSKMGKYKFVDKGKFSLTHAAKVTLEKDSQGLNQKENLWTILGVVLCIISPIAIFFGGIFGESGYVYGIIILICIVAMAVFIFINKCGAMDIYNKLFKMGKFSKISESDNKVIDTVSNIVWPLTTVVFLVWGFQYDGWGICWIVFPIVGILLGGFTSAYKAAKGIRE